MLPHVPRRAWLDLLLTAGALLVGPAAIGAVLLAAQVGLVVPPGSAPRYSGPKGREGDVTELVATAEQTGGSLGLFRQTIAPGSGPPAHVHRTEDEFFYVVKGDFRVKVGEQVTRVPPESVLFVPRGTAHAFLNVGTEPGVLLVGVTPGGFEQMFRERQGVDPDANKALMKLHRMEVVGPPLQ